MTSERWNDYRLDDLADIVKSLRSELKAVREEDIQELRKKLSERMDRDRSLLLMGAVPVFCCLVLAIVTLVHG